MIARALASRSILALFDSPCFFSSFFKLILFKKMIRSALRQNQVVCFDSTRIGKFNYFCFHCFIFFSQRGDVHLNTFCYSFFLLLSLVSVSHHLLKSSHYIFLHLCSLFFFFYSELISLVFFQFFFCFVIGIICSHLTLLVIIFLF